MKNPACCLPAPGLPARCLIARCLIALSATAALLVLASCAESRTAAKAEKLEPAQCGSVEKIHREGTIYLAGQPSADDFRAAKELGIRAVVNLRRKQEMPDRDEEAEVKGLGLEYHNVPIGSPDDLTDETLDQLRALLRGGEEQPLLLHCASANRVGAVWLAHRVLDDGRPYPEALEEAKRVGLRSQEMEKKVQGYIGRREKETAKPTPP